MLNNEPGVLLIRGASGSGKTTTALLRLEHLCVAWRNRKQRLDLHGPVRVLVLTYNRTLEGYVRALAEATVPDGNDLVLEVSTFAHFAAGVVGTPTTDDATTILEPLIESFGLPTAFVEQEVEYALGRFPAKSIRDYIQTPRDGRGLAPRMDTVTKTRLVEEVLRPYLLTKFEKQYSDWHDQAHALANANAEPWDVIIVDEAQDFSANKIRAILAQASPDSSVTFVLDTAQRIYPNSFTWKEVGVDRPASHRLTRNYRNTRQIAAFARPLIDDLSLNDDGAIPDYRSALRDGPKPNVGVGNFSAQMQWVLHHTLADREPSETVAFLHPLGGGWFRHVESALHDSDTPYIRLTRKNVWPDGPETIALSTIHSAKGLEFDHIAILGLNQEVLKHGDEDGDGRYENLRRLLAMGIGRARKTVTIGYKSTDSSRLLSLLDPTTFNKIVV